MKIGVMSDTHGSIFYFEKAMEILEDCDVILHGGDILNHGPRNIIPNGYNPKELFDKINETKNIIITKGNCDFDVDQMVINHPIQTPNIISQFGELRIMLTHGYLDTKEDMIKKAKDMSSDILIFGHTHIKELYLDENLIVLNPGSTTIPKDGTHSVAIIELKEELDELDIDFKFIDILTKEIININ